MSLKKASFRAMTKKEKIAVAGACSASAVASVLLRAPDLMAFPIFVIAQNREQIAERLRKTEKMTEHEIKCFFHGVDDIVKKGEGKLRSVM